MGTYPEFWREKIKFWNLSTIPTEVGCGLGLRGLELKLHEVPIHSAQIP